MYRYLLVIILILSGVNQAATAQNKPTRHQVITAISKKSAGDRPVKLSGNNITGINISRDGDGNSSTGKAFLIKVTKEKVSRYVNPDDDTPDGVVSFYINNDDTKLSRVINEIDNARLSLTSSRPQSKAVKGVTKLEILKDGKVWITLVDSKATGNVKGDFQALVDRLVTMLGGEPDYSSFGEPDVTIDDDIMDIYEPIF